MSSRWRRLLRRRPGITRVSAVLSCAFADTPLLPDALAALTEYDAGLGVGLEVVVAPWGPGNPDALVALVEKAAAGSIARPGADVVLAELAGTGNAARNAGAERASGDHLVFLDPHDRLAPGTLAALLAGLVGEPGADGAPVGVRQVVRVAAEPDPLRPAGYLFDAEYWRETGLAFDPAHGDFPQATMARVLLGEVTAVDAEPAAHVADVAAPWPARLETWLAMVPAVRQTLAGPAKAAWVRHLVVAELPDLLADAERLPFEQMPLLADTVGAVLATLRPRDLARLPVVPRVAVWLAGQAQWEPLAALLAGLPTSGDLGYPTVIEGRTVQAVLPGVDVEELRVPPLMLEVSPAESGLFASVRRVRWLVGDRGDLSGGPVLAVDVCASVRHVDLSDPVVQARWVGPRRSVPAVVRRRPDAYARVLAGEAYQDAADASVTVLVALSGLSPGTWRLELAVSQDDVVRTGRPTHRDLGGSAGSMRPSPDGAAQPFWHAETGFGVLVDHARAFERDARPGLHVVRARREDGWIAFDTVGHLAGTPALVGDHERIEGHLDGEIIRFRLRSDRFGLGERPAPSGSYRLLVGDRPVPWDDEAADDLAFDVLTGEHRVGLRRSTQGTVQVVLRAPLADDELGAFSQHLLREWYDVRERLVDRVLLESAAGRACDGSPLALDRALRRQRPELERVWQVDDHSVVVPPGARAVLRHSREWFELLATSRWLVTDGDPPEFFERREGQDVLQTLPGQPTRVVGEPAWVAAGMAPRRVDLLLRRSSGQWSALTSPGPQLTGELREAFRYEGEVLATGLPRGDLVTGPDAADRRDRTREALGIGAEQTVVLHAPDPGPRPPRSNRMRTLLEVTDLCEGLGEEYTVLHRGVVPLRQATTTGARLVDVTAYPRAADLVLACNAAVLDYSPLRFDAALAGRPIVFFVPDPAVRRGDARGFVVPYLETAPGPVVATVPDVVERLRDLDSLERQHGAQLARFNAVHQPLADGRAADRVVASFFGRASGAMAAG